MDSCEIRSARDVEKVIVEPEKFQELNSIAAEASASPGGSPRTNNPIVAGRGIDLSGELTGADEHELIDEIDRAFGVAWHYFDEVIVEGLSARRYMKMISNNDDDLARGRVRAHCILLLHLRKIGALDSVVFRQKPDPCVRHGDDASILEDAGLKRILDDRMSIVEILAEGTLHDIEDHYFWAGDGHFHYVYEHPLVGVVRGGIEGSPAGYEVGELKRLISSNIFDLYATYAAADVAIASECSAPLATMSPILESILGGSGSKTAVDTRSLVNDVAIEIGLPILHGVSASDLLKIREDESDAFERFRVALRTVINEVVKKSDQSVNPSGAAVSIVEEFLIPALHDIDQRLGVARKALTRKSVANVSVGATAVVAGLIAGIPLLLPAGIALGMAVPGANLAKYLEEKGQVELSDMYFLWKLQNRTVR